MQGQVVDVKEGNMERVVQRLRPTLVVLAALGLVLTIVLASCAAPAAVPAQTPAAKKEAAVPTPAPKPPETPKPVATPTPAPKPAVTPTPAPKVEAKLPAAKGADLVAYLKAENYEKNWKHWPGKQPKYQGREPHGALLSTYLNAAAFDALSKKAGTMPAGSIIVKENYMPDGKLDAYTVMYKVQGFDAANNDWFWIKYKADGTIEAEGKVDMCIGCHTAQKANDYIYTGPLK